MNERAKNRYDSHFPDLEHLIYHILAMIHKVITTHLHAFTLTFHTLQLHTLHTSHTHELHIYTLISSYTPYTIHILPPTYTSHLIITLSNHRPYINIYITMSSGRYFVTYPTIICNLLSHNIL